MRYANARYVKHDKHGVHYVRAQFATHTWLSFADFYGTVGQPIARTLIHETLNSGFQTSFDRNIQKTKKFENSTFLSCVTFQVLHEFLVWAHIQI